MVRKQMVNMTEFLQRLEALKDRFREDLVDEWVEKVVALKRAAGPAGADPAEIEAALHAILEPKLDKFEADLMALIPPELN